MKKFVWLKWIIFVALMWCICGSDKGMDNNVPNVVDTVEEKSDEQNGKKRKRIDDDYSQNICNWMCEKQKSKYTGKLVRVTQDFRIKDITFNKGEFLKIGENEIRGNTIENLDGKTKENPNVDEIEIMDKNVEKLENCICCTEDLSMLTLNQIIILKCNHAIVCKSCFIGWFVKENKTTCPNCRENHDDFDICECTYKNKDITFTKNVIKLNPNLLCTFIDLVSIYENNDQFSKDLEQFMKECKKIAVLQRLINRKKNDSFPKIEKILKNLALIDPISNEMLLDSFIKGNVLISMASYAKISEIETLIMLILNRFQDPNSKDKLKELLLQEDYIGYTLLMKAAEEATDLYLIEFILKSFSKDELLNYVSKRNGFGENAFLHAVLNEDDQISYKIIELLTAVFENEKQILAKIILDMGPYPRKDHFNVLIMAFSHHNAIEIMRALFRLFEHDDELNDMLLMNIFKNGKTLLHRASTYGGVELFQFVVSAFKSKANLMQLIMRKDKNIFHFYLDDKDRRWGEKYIGILINQFDTEYNKQFVECMEKIKNGEGENVLERAEKKSLNDYRYHNVSSMLQEKLKKVK